MVVDSFEEVSPSDGVEDVGAELDDGGAELEEGGLDELEGGVELVSCGADEGGSAELTGSEDASSLKVFTKIRIGTPNAISVPGFGSVSMTFSGAAVGL